MGLIGDGGTHRNGFKGIDPIRDLTDDGQGIPNVDRLNESDIDAMDQGVSPGEIDAR